MNCLKISKLEWQSTSWRTKSRVKCLKCRRSLKCKNIKRFKRFKPQAFQASSFKADPDFRQDDTFVRSNQLPWLRKLFLAFSFIFTDGIMLLVFKFAMLAWLSWQSASFTSMRSLVQIQARAPIFIKFISFFPREMGLAWSKGVLFYNNSKVKDQSVRFF